jgi:hypothetical protein
VQLDWSKLTLEFEKAFPKEAGKSASKLNIVRELLDLKKVKKSEHNDVEESDRPLVVELQSNTFDRI